VQRNHESGGIVIVYRVPERPDSGNGEKSTFCNRDIFAIPATRKRSAEEAWGEALQSELAVSYLVFPLVAARGQAVMQALIRSAVPLTGIPPPDALFSRLHFSVQAASF
jgi:hypothetical protein